MPLIKSGSKKAVSTNIEEMMAAGHPQKQAVAAALSNQRRYRGKDVGGSAFGVAPQQQQTPWNFGPGFDGITQMSPLGLGQAMPVVNPDAPANSLPYVTPMSPLGLGQAQPFLGDNNGSGVTGAFNVQSPLTVTSATAGNPVTPYSNNTPTLPQPKPDTTQVIPNTQVAPRQTAAPVQTNDNDQRPPNSPQQTMNDPNHWSASRPLPSGIRPGGGAGVTGAPGARPGTAASGGKIEGDEDGKKEIFKGPIVSHVPGRTDKHYTHVESGAYVIPADVVSGEGQGNTLAGMHVLHKLFRLHGTPESSATELARGGKAHKGKPVPVKLAGGEIVVPPDNVHETMQRLTKRKMTLDQAHAALDKWVVNRRKKLRKTLAKLPGPVKD